MLTVRVVRCTYDKVLVDQIISVLDGLQVILQASLALLEHALLQLEIIQVSLGHLIHVLIHHFVIILK